MCCVIVCFVIRVRLLRFHFCVLDSCLVGLVGQLRAVPLLISGFFSDLSYRSTACVPTPVSWVGWFVLWIDELPAVPILCAGFLSVFSVSTSCSPTAVCRVLVWFVSWIKVMLSPSCVACFLDQNHAVPLLCPGFLSGLSCGSNSCGSTPMSWVLVRFVFLYKFMWSYSCVLASYLDCFLDHSHKVPLLCPGFYSGLSCKKYGLLQDFGLGPSRMGRSSICCQGFGFCLRGMG